MLKLAVITHTSGKNTNKHLYDTAMNSVAKSLPFGAEHKVIVCNSRVELASARWACLDLAEYICFVDDDDRVINNSIALCLEALESNPHLGVAFTNEKYINLDGEEIKSPHDKDRSPVYEQVKFSAQVIHHLVMIRTRVADIQGKRLSDAVGIGGEWMLKGGTALKSGAIHVPIEGYEWRQHPTQHSKDDVWRLKYNDSMHLLQVYLASQNYRSGEIERFKI